MSNYREMTAEKLAGWKKTILAYQCLIKPCMILFAVYTIGISAIIRADFNYRDDLRRVLTGKKNWGGSYGRYLSDFFSTFLHIDDYLMDNSPLSQLIAVLLVAVAAGIIWYVFSEKTDFSFWHLAALVPLGLCPYFLACISYKYDAPYMALSVLVSVVPLLFREKRYVWYTAAVFLCTVAMCTTYQAASGIFLMFVILVCIKRWNQEEDLWEILKFAGVSMLGYLIGLILYKLFLMPHRETYVSNAMPRFTELIPVALSNLKKYFACVKNDFKIEWLIFTFVLCVAFVFVMVRDSKREKRAAFFMSSFALLLMLLLCFGMYPLLVKPLYHPRAMYGFGAFLTFVGIAVSTAKKTYPAKVICLALSWCFFAFSFLYGNALKVQDDYIEFRTMELMDDCKDLDCMVSDAKITIQVDGSIGYAPAIKHMPQNYKMLKRLIPLAYKDGNWSLHKFRYYGWTKKKVRWNRPVKEDFATYNFPVIKDSMYHTIRGKDNCILIEMK